MVGHHNNNNQRPKGTLKQHSMDLIAGLQTLGTPKLVGRQAQACMQWPCVVIEFKSGSS